MSPEPFHGLIDALPMKPFAVQALAAVESFCLVAMAIVLLLLAVQMLWGCLKSFTVLSLVTCAGIALCAVISFFSLDWRPGLIGTGVVLALHVLGSDPLRRAEKC